MGATGSPATRLIVLRGTSGSGKSTVARLLQERVDAPLAWVEQDHLRRMFLRERDVDSGAARGLVDQAVRYVLDRGVHVVLEGRLVAHHYGSMLRRLRADHRGLTRAYYLDVAFEEVLRRHPGRPDPAALRQEERDRAPTGDLVDGLREQLIASGDALEAIVEQIVADTGLEQG